MEGERLESEEARLEREDEIGNFISLSSLFFFFIIFIPPGYHGQGSQDQTRGERQRQPVQRVSHRDLPGPRHPERDRLQQVGHVVTSNV